MNKFNRCFIMAFACGLGTTCLVSPMKSNALTLVAAITGVLFGVLAATHKQ